MLVTNEDPLQDLDVDLNFFNELYPNYGEDSYNFYYSSERFNEKFSSANISDFSLIHVNIRSLSKNGEDFSYLLSILKVKFDVICFSETWDHNLAVLDSFFPNYIGYHCTRATGNRGGGVSIFLNKTRDFEIVDKISIVNEHIECILLNFSCRDKKISFG